MVGAVGSCSLLRISCSVRCSVYAQKWGYSVVKAAGASKQTAKFSSGRVPDFAFAFDIDGVLLRSSKPLPGATKALLTLQKQGIPYILLTNGGGKLESERVQELSERLEIPLRPNIFIQSHTPYAALEAKQKQGYILVLGGEGQKCRKVAESYGFKNVIIPSDIFHAHPEIWPFSAPFSEYHARAALPLPLPLFRPTKAEPNPVEGKHLRIHSMYVYNDPRDMGLDTQLVLDLLLSHKGFLGTISELNGRDDLPNHGYQEDSQPLLYFANPDLFWAGKYHLSRLGSGGFQASLRGLWNEATGRQGIDLKAINGGKPHRITYQYAEDKIVRRLYGMYDEELKGTDRQVLPKRIYMIGDNPASDITGANSFESPAGRQWLPILVRSGVWRGELPNKVVEKPYKIVDGVYDAVQSVLQEEGWWSGTKLESSQDEKTFEVLS